MIKQLIGHIAQEQVDAIVGTIISQYRRYLLLINSSTFSSIFSEEYKPHKRQHSVSWAISSAFPSNRSPIEGLGTNRLTYGKGHTRPELSNSAVAIHILNKTTHFQADYLKQYYQMNANGFTNSQLYCYFRFEVEKNHLTKIALCLPNEDGTIFEEETLLNEKAIIQLVA